MKVAGLISFVKIVVVLAVCSLGSNARAEIDYLSILTFGDSITQGYARDAEGTEYGILEPLRGARTILWGYQIELEIMIEDTLGPGTSSVYNWGYHGLRSDQVLMCDRDWDCIDEVLSSREADVILILLGANDLYNGIQPSDTRFNLLAMIDKSVAHNVRPVLGTITPNTSGDINAASINDYYNPMIRELALEKKVPLAEHYEAMVDNWDASYTSGDGLHLNETGNRKLAQTWYDAVMKHLTSPAPEPEPVVIQPILHLLLKDT